jgi:hypothetical protein
VAEDINGQSQATLPPLPPSDEKSIVWNQRDSFYDVRARDFWGKNQIVREIVKDYEKCNHYFIRKGSEVECKKCHFGLICELEIKDGQLIYEGKPLEI